MTWHRSQSTTREIMVAFSRRTGLIGDRAPQRYLWTDAFAVWLERAHQETRAWSEHRNINDVMLATSLAPDTYLSIWRN